MSTPTDWIKATASGGSQNCVEMRREGEAILVRDSKKPEGAILRFTPREFAAWVDGAQKGEFDHLR